MKKHFPVIIVIAVIAMAMAFGWWRARSEMESEKQSNSSATPTSSIVYTDPTYGFRFALPASWQGYSVITSTWIGENADGTAVTQGPVIALRHPAWTVDVPRQDIPIMVFTIADWNNLLTDMFHVGAAPINPSEIGRNNKYVFALPARYNYAFPAGYEEVAQILGGTPLTTFSVMSK